MSITLELNPDALAGLQSEAESQGRDVSEVAAEFLNQRFAKQANVCPDGQSMADVFREALGPDWPGKGGDGRLSEVEAPCDPMPEDGMSFADRLEAAMEPFWALQRASLPSSRWSEVEAACDPLPKSERNIGTATSDVSPDTTGEENLHVAKLLLPSCPLHGTEELTVGDFWSWAYSDILSNRNRGIFAEFLVAAALGYRSSPRVEWDGVDIRYRNKSIEVKSAAYVQSWKQNRLSTIKWGIARSSGDPVMNTAMPEPVRAADCYVFCLYPEQERALADVLDVASWLFYVTSTSVINERFGAQRSVGLKSVQQICGEAVTFRELAKAIDNVLASSEHWTPIQV